MSTADNYEEKKQEANNTHMRARAQKALWKVSELSDQDLCRTNHLKSTGSPTSLSERVSQQWKPSAKKCSLNNDSIGTRRTHDVVVLESTKQGFLLLCTSD